VNRRGPWATVVRILPTVSVLMLLAAWQIIGSRINPIFLSTPVKVVQAGKDLIENGELLPNTWISFWTFVVSLFGGLVLGAPIGILMGRYQVLSKLLGVQVRLFYSLPIIALFPLFILWFGLGVKLRLLSIFLAAFLPIVMSAEAGVRNVDRTLIEVATVYGSRPSELFRKIIAPASVPFIAAGFKIAIGRAIVTTIGIELLNAQEGLGGLMSKYGNQFQTARYFAPLVVAAAMSIVMYVIGDWVERRFSSWRTSGT
jgi:NitT/TauT family transport system permease protein